MTDTLTPLELVDAGTVARLEQILARMEALTGESVMPLAGDTLPARVAAGDLIQSAWGNAVVDTLTVRVGVGVWLSAQSVPAGTNPPIAWINENYDTDNFHVPNATDLIIPAGRAGVYAATLQLNTPGAVTANSLVRLIVPPAPGGTTIYQATMVVGQQIAAVSYVGPMAVGAHVSATFWNAGAAAVFVAGTLELVRVAI